MSLLAHQPHFVTASAAPTFVTTVNPISFADPANVPAATTSIKFRARLRHTPVPGAGTFLFAVASTTCDLSYSSGIFRVTVEDSTGLKVISQWNSPVVVPTDGQFYDIEFEGNHTTQAATITLNGVSTVKPFDVPGNGVFASNRKASLLGNSAGASNWPASDFEYLELYYNGVLRKRIQASDGAAAINADTTWKAGTGSVV